MTEQQLLLDCVSRLNRSGIDYMLTGSMASNAWGIPRTTHDLDFVVQFPPSQIPDLIAAFGHPDYFLDEASIHAAYQPPHQFNFIHVPSALKADFWLLRNVPFDPDRPRPSSSILEFFIKPFNFLANQEPQEAASPFKISSMDS